ncbi:putative acetamidase/formamidase [Rubrobacter radiotolerans]|uniref:Acetamidase/formamidase family protein n=1 Tax=Rubrobacter radiotolerans TaxID=42256 RepID=A0A023WZQ0_RUBRA|nr:acetamidase/formamidase family protein [Rubrobacter radiotolerans]AHY45697.1 putative acetamidase/formamidase [Rubrobacter radiotolerans]MDX5893111.1 acetamidase/formamidase family protein [Rubrobacter radiotolerans]SMC03079.1 Acetamidase/formamidase [Rubrobacter radiotolerans DSM 5868]
MARTHYFDPDTVHYRWSKHYEPALTIRSGDTVVFETREVSDGQIGPDSDASALDAFDWDRIYPLCGPVAVEDAEPGDILEVEMLDIQTRGWGWTASIPGTGLLPEDFPNAHLKIFDLTNGDYTFFRHDIAIPIEPFFGTTGVCPDGEEETAVMPPGPFGGNLDTRHITKGSILRLPVQVPGALFSCGDAHAAQGDGEVCVTGIECPMFAAMRFNLVKTNGGRTLPAPQFMTPGPLTPKVDAGGWYATMGIGPDLMQATKDSVRAMIDHISDAYEMSPEDAYLLCSLAVDLKISEVVDAPNWIVSSYLPFSIFRTPIG